MSRRSYLGAAFNARPLGMPIPPNWFGLAAFGLLGALLNPGFWLIGAGLEVAYLALLSRSKRFRAVVDAGARVRARTDPEEWARRRQALLDELEPSDRRTQAEIEERCVEIASGLRGRVGGESQIEGLTRLAWLHLRLLSARAAVRRVEAKSPQELPALDRAEQDLRARLSRSDLDADLRLTLEQQASVLEARRAAHAQAARRLERLDAEVERIRQQIALVREQTLLAVDDAELGRSVDALSASLTEANRWLQEERDLLAGLDLDAAPPPDVLLAPASTPRRRSRRAQEEST